MKKIKSEDTVDGDTDEKEYRDQVKLLYKYRDKLKSLDHKELVELLEKNQQEIPSGKDNVSFYSSNDFFLRIVIYMTLLLFMKEVMHFQIIMILL